MHRIEIGSAGKPFAPCFMAFGYANCDFTYTAPTLRMFDHLASYANHGRYMRLHNVLTMHGEGDRYFLEGSDYGNPTDGGALYDKVFRREGDRIVADWTLVDRVYDLFLEHGFRPIVETHRMPACVQEGAAAIYQGGPTDYRRWQEVIRLFTEHVVERYGLDEVREWWFEVWNEPDGTRAFKEDFHKFFALYDYMEAAVHGMDEHLRVGGPATMQGETSFLMFQAFLAHCADGVNYVDGTLGTRVDFLSVHCKGGFPHSNCPDSDVMFNDLKRYIAILDRFPRYRQLPFFNDESDIIWCGNLGKSHKNWLNFRNTQYFPGFVCKMVDRYYRELVDDLGVNLAIVDSDNCHQQWERGLFSGNRSQLTPLGNYPCTDLIRKAAFNAYPLLARLGDERLPTTCVDSDFAKRKFGAVATRRGQGLALMIWHFEDGMETDVPTRTINLHGNGLLPAGAYRLVEFRIDRDHSNPYQVWKERGMPAAPDRDLIRELRRRDGLELATPVTDLVVGDDLALAVTLPMHAVSLLLVVPVNAVAPSAPVWHRAAVEPGVTGAPQVVLTWRPNAEQDFLHYRLFRGIAEGEATCIAEDDSFGCALHIDMDIIPGTTVTYTVEAVNASGVVSSRSGPMTVSV